MIYKLAIFNDNSNGRKAGISVVCTELVGSNPDDLYYAKKVIDFNKKNQPFSIFRVLDSN